MINLVKGVTKMNVNFEVHRNKEAKDDIMDHLTFDARCNVKKYD
jgi:hypothetical protein